MQEVRRLRQERGWSQAELAFYAKLAPSVISEIETGKRDPSASTLRKLANGLDVSVPALFEEPEALKAEPPLPFEDRPAGDLDALEQRRWRQEYKQGQQAGREQILRALAGYVLPLIREGAEREHFVTALRERGATRDQDGWDLALSMIARAIVGWDFYENPELREAGEHAVERVNDQVRAASALAGEVLQKFELDLGGALGETVAAKPTEHEPAEPADLGWALEASEEDFEQRLEEASVEEIVELERAIIEAFLREEDDARRRRSARGIRPYSQRFFQLWDRAHIAQRHIVARRGDPHATMITPEFERRAREALQQWAGTQAE